MSPTPSVLSCALRPVLVVLAAMTALAAATLVGVSPASAAQGWKVGDCYAKAEVTNDGIDLGSKVDCSRPHMVQIIGGTALPAAFSKYTHAQLTDTSNTTLRDQLVAFSDKACGPARTAPGMWPKQAKAIIAALKEPAKSTGGGVLAGLLGASYGWVFPDAARYAAGDKSMICVLQRYTTDDQPASDAMLVGDARALSTSAPLDSMRTCYLKTGAGEYSTISCAKPHTDELMTHFAVRLPADYDDMTSAQWAAFDTQCTALVTALVGAKRKDITGFADMDPSFTKGRLVYADCYARRASTADIPPNLPGGTVVGLGTKALPKA